MSYKRRDYSRWEAPWPGARRTSEYEYQTLRVSDAERNEVADALSRHCSDGRLTMAEFEERLAKVMSAKTRADLAPLLADLPGLRPIEPAPGPPPRARRGPGLLAIIAIGLILSFSIRSVFWAAHIPWILVLLVVVFLWRRSRGSHYHRHPPEIDR